MAISYQALSANPQLPDDLARLNGAVYDAGLAVRNPVAGDIINSSTVLSQSSGSTPTDVTSLSNKLRGHPIHPTG